jgi:hypothetical protein
MSHFTVLVTKTNKTPLDEQLAPFDENLNVTPYQEPCWCVDRKARNDASDQTPVQLGTSWDDFSREWHAATPEFKSSHSWEEFTKPLHDLETMLEEAHPLHDKPDPDCTDCEGTGKRTTTYNPDSRWNWYQVGGRWRGYFKLKQGATGQLGEAGAFDNEPLHDADIARAGDIDWQAMREHARQASVATYAVLHDGTWHARGDMDWFGISNDIMTYAEWDKEFSELVDSLDPDDEVTVVDCHI